MTEDEKGNELIDDIIRFFEQEKEIYGPFSTETDRSEEKAVTQKGQDQADRKSEEIIEEKIPISAQKGQKKQKVTIAEKLEACNTLEELKQLCSVSEELQTDLEGTNLVFGVGNPEADLMIVGEAPGYNEDQQGEPFVGAAGKLLNKILAAIHFDRQDVYIANILKHRPPDNRNPLPEERQRSLPFLEKQVDLISPKVILCVGKVSGTTLLDTDEALKRMRGKFYPYRGSELTVTYHPAALLRNPKWKRPTWEDVQNVRKKYDELGGKS